MEDVVTDVPPPSRFSPDDLDNFASPPPLPTPILVVSPNPRSPAPRILIVLISPTSLALLANLPSPPPLHASLLLPDLSLQSHEPIRVYLHPSGALLAAVHSAVPAHRARAAAKALVSKLQPEEVLVLDAVRSDAYRGRLAADEPVEGKLETRAARRQGGVGAAKGVTALALPGSVVDGLGAAVLPECEIASTYGAGARKSPFSFVAFAHAAELPGPSTRRLTAAPQILPLPMQRSSSFLCTCELFDEMHLQTPVPD